MIREVLSLGASNRKLQKVIVEQVAIILIDRQCTPRDDSGQDPERTAVHAETPAEPISEENEEILLEPLKRRLTLIAAPTVKQPMTMACSPARAIMSIGATSRLSFQCGPSTALNSRPGSAAGTR